MARKDISMTPDEISAFMDEQKTVQVATIGADGFPHVAPMWFVVEDGKVVFRSFTKSQKILNLRRNPKLTVLLESGEAYDELRGLMIKGMATLVDDRAEVLRIYGAVSMRYTLAGGETLDLHPDALEAMFGRYADKNTAVVVEPESVISWDHRKLGGAY